MDYRVVVERFYSGTASRDEVGYAPRIHRLAEISGASAALAADEHELVPSSCAYRFLGKSAAICLGWWRFVRVGQWGCCHPGNGTVVRRQAGGSRAGHGCHAESGCAVWRP